MRFVQFFETLLVFEEPKERDRMRNKREIKILTNACYLALNHTEGLISVEKCIKSKTAQAITTENKAAIMLDCSGNRSNSFDMQRAEPMFEFCHSLLIPVAINSSHDIAFLVTWQMVFI